MNQNMWKAIYDFADETFIRPADLCDLLIENGTLPRGSNLEALDDYVVKKTYKAMYEFLEGAV